MYQDQSWTEENNHLTSISNGDTTFGSHRYCYHKRQSQIVGHHLEKARDLVELKSRYIHRNLLILLEYYKDTKVLTKVLHSTVKNIDLLECYK